MTGLRAELIDYINDIPDEKLLAIKPLLSMLSKDTLSIEKVSFEDLTDYERASVIQAEKDFINGETVSHNAINWD